MRVGFFGNVANSLFQVVRALRDRAGIDAHLYVSRTDAFSSRPETVDPALDGNLPPWIHDGDWITRSAVLTPWRAPITAELKAYDLLVVSGAGPIFAQWTGRPWGWFVTGGDLTVKPFPIAFLGWYKSWEQKAGELVGGVWQRRGGRRADRLFVQPFRPMADSLARLKVPPAAISPRYLPIVLDTHEFRPDRPFGQPDDPVVQRMLAADLAVLHPSRLLMRNDPRLFRTGQWKGNDVLIRGFAELVRTGKVDDPLLVMLDTGLSRDLDAGKALVSELGIGEQVLWAKPPRPDTFPRHRLLDLYLAADVVASDFGAGWFGYVTLEGLAVGKPVLNHLDAGPMAQLYPDGHPIVEAATPADVCAQLLRLAQDPAERARIGEESRRWVVAHHSFDSAGARYVEAINELIVEIAGPRREEESRRPSL